MVVTPTVMRNGNDVPAAFQTLLLTFIYSSSTHLASSYAAFRQCKLNHFVNDVVKRLLQIHELAVDNIAILLVYLQ